MLLDIYVVENEKRAEVVVHYKNASRLTCHKIKNKGNAVLVFKLMHF